VKGQTKNLKGLRSKNNLPYLRCVKPPYVSWYKLLGVVFCLDFDLFFFLLLFPCGLFFLYLFIYKRKWDIKQGDPKETPNILLSFDWVQKMDLAPSMWTLHGGDPGNLWKETLVSILGLCKVSLLYTSGPLGLAQWSVDLPINHQASKDLKVQKSQQNMCVGWLSI
jgi:hypothetical protein